MWLTNIKCPMFFKELAKYVGDIFLVQRMGQPQNDYVREYYVSENGRDDGGNDRENVPYQ